MWTNYPKHLDIDHLLHEVPEVPAGVARIAEVSGATSLPAAAMKGVVATVRAADRPGLRATMATPRGTVQLT